MSRQGFVPVRVPSEADFGEDGDDFLDDPLLDRLLLDVIGAYPALRHIEAHGISVRALWKRKDGKSHGALTYAKCVKPSGLLAHFCKVDFVIWVAADNVELEGWTTVQLSKLLYHEARHIEWNRGDDEHDAKAKLKGHDIELFGGVRRSSKADYQPHCDWCEAALARQAAKDGVAYVQGALI